MGAIVFLSARNEARLRETMDMMEGEGHQIITADLTNEADILALVEQLPVLDGVVLNAGVAGLVPTQAISAAKLQEMQQINAAAEAEYASIISSAKVLSEGYLKAARDSAAASS